MMREYSWRRIMPFCKGDENINRKGRGLAKDLVNPKSISGNELRIQDFKQMLRRLKPLNKKALTWIEKMLDDENTTEQTRMRLIALILKEYQTLMNEVYKPEKLEGNDVDKDELDLAPIVQFTVQKKG